MISKELAQEVAGYIGGIFSVEADDFNGDILIYDNATERRRFNKYELAHKCKEWAKENGYWIDSNLGFVSIGKNGTQAKVKCFNGYDLKLNEAELIFKACEWIKEQHDN